MNIFAKSTIGILVLVGFGVEACASSFYVDVRESEDLFRTITRRHLQTGENIRIDLNKVGLQYCKVGRTEAIIHLYCIIDKERSVSGSCSNTGPNEYEIDFSRRGYMISIKAICGGK
jgi:hypothetical protein